MPFVLIQKQKPVEAVEDDPPCTLSVVEGSMVERHLQASQQITPYGINLVRAPDFWNQYGKRGAGIKVCVIDSGLRRTHRDIRGGDLSGSNGEGLVIPVSYLAY
jgi:subtilisin family serine protease